MNWKIVTEQIDKKNNLYSVILKDEKGLNIVYKVAEGKRERTKMTKEIALKYSSFIDKIEHL